MAVQGLLVSLTTSPTVVAGDGGLHGVIRVTLRNRGTGTAYLGGSDVTTAGFPVTTAENPLAFTVFQGETLYGTSTGAAILDVLRMNETTA